MNAALPSRRGIFELPNAHLLRGAAWLVVSLASCGGKTDDAQAPLSTCGASCGVEQVSASCASTCSKLLATGCYDRRSSLDQCTQECTKFAAGGQCPQAIAFLRCAEMVTATCSAGKPDFGPTCMARLKDADRCSGGADVAGAMPIPAGTAEPPLTVPTDDPAICPTIPRQGSSTRECLRSGLASNGADAALQCTTTCHDVTGNLWEAKCTGNTCACSYNRAPMCTCTVTAGGDFCQSCCPGTN